MRVYYKAGYHVDLPIYRRVTSKDANGNEEKYNELASTNWRRSDARNVTAWFDSKEQEITADTIKGGQVRRIVREIKNFASSRSSWKGSILSGFGITKLVTEEYRGNADREDKALYLTMKAIRDRLDNNLVVEHPVTPDETITSGDKDTRAAFLRDKLSDAIRWLEPLFKLDCTREEALKCWDKVFNTSYFSERLESKEESSSKSSAVFSAGLLGNVQPERPPVSKSGPNRYA